MSADDYDREARRLIESGYCPVSNRYRMLSRLDRPDWLAFMAFKHTAGFPGDAAKNLQQGVAWAAGLGVAAAADHYRRCNSKDVLMDVPEPVFRQVKAARGSHGWGGVDSYQPLAVYCTSDKSVDGGSCSERVPCDGVRRDGIMSGGCAEPCSFAMERDQ